MSLLKELRPSFQRLVILTGAGISAESGLATFRGSDGLWCNYRIEEVATPEGFMANPELVQRFYNARRKQLSEVLPNCAHEALSRLEKEWEGEFLLITQNVDDLHERAGSQSLLHMHGELLKARCQYSGKIHPWSQDILQEITPCPCCQKTATLRPHIVWFGEMPLFMERIYQALSQCDLFIAIGTSGQVYPAAGFVSEAKHSGAFTVEMNLEATSTVFDEGIYGSASTTVPALVEMLLER